MAACVCSVDTCCTCGQCCGCGLLKWPAQIRLLPYLRLHHFFYSIWLVPPPAEGPPSTGVVQSCLHTLCSPGAASGTARGHSTAQHMLHGRVFGFSGADGCSPNLGLRYPTPPDFGHPATHHLIGQKWAGRNLGRIETSTPRFVLALSPGGQVGSCTSRASNGPRFVNQPSL